MGWEDGGGRAEEAVPTPLPSVPAEERGMTGGGGGGMTDCL